MADTEKDKAAAVAAGPPKTSEAPKGDAAPEGAHLGPPVEPLAGPNVMIPYRGPGRPRGSTNQPSSPQIDANALAAAIVGAQKSYELQSRLQSATPDLDETVPGGAYHVDGRLVDALGEEIKDKKVLARVKAKALGQDQDED